MGKLCCDVTLWVVGLAKIPVARTSGVAFWAEMKDRDKQDAPLLCCLECRSHIHDIRTDINVRLGQRSLIRTQFPVPYGVLNCRTMDVYHLKFSEMWQLCARK